jgi:hypothetical protein
VSMVDAMLRAAVVAAAPARRKEESGTSCDHADYGRHMNGVEPSQPTPRQYGPTMRGHL